jgi:hypothetical protein
MVKTKTHLTVIYTQINNPSTRHTGNTSMVPENWQCGDNVIIRLHADDVVDAAAAAAAAPAAAVYVSGC